MSAPPGTERPTVPHPRRAAVLFVLGLAVYAATRSYGLARFPIFFFCDEAVQANVADRLLHNHFRDAEGVLLPPYFLNDQRWAMSLNIYLLVLPIAALGKSVLVTRGVFVLVSLFGAAALGLALRTAGIGLWWVAPLLLAVLPVDFLHSRLAFETTPAFYAGFLWAYLLYRLRSPRWVFLAIALGAATFYSYTAGQGLLLVMGPVLLLTDARYHLRQPRKLLAAAGLFMLIVAVPFLREQRRHPGTTRDQLLVIHSYWITPIPLAEKLATFGKRYLTGLEPGYWFQPNEAELIRHRMDRMAYVPLALAPFVALGVLVCLWRFRASPGHRVILLSPLAVPFAAAVHERQILRVLPMIVPIVLLAAVGFDAVVRRLSPPVPRLVLDTGLAVLLGTAALRLTRLALRDGPFWSRDYGLYGLQYGAPQVCAGIRQSLARSPDTRVLMSPTWANNPNQFLDFFLRPGERDRASIGGIGDYLFSRMPVADTDLFVLTADEYAQIRDSPKFRVLPPERVVPYPDGRPGFYFVRFGYSPEADAIFAAEREARRKPQEERITLDGQSVLVRHPMEASGRVVDLFDNRFDTTLKGLEANPFFIELDFENPRRISRIDLLITKMDADIRIDVTPASGGQRLELTRKVRNLETDTRVEFPFPDGAIEAARARVEIFLPYAKDPAHVEVREIELK